MTRQGARFSAVWAPMRNLVSRWATLSRPLPPAPTRGRQSLRGPVPHCRRLRSNGAARTSGHLCGARGSARSDKTHPGAFGFEPSRSGTFFRQGEFPPSHSPTVSLYLFLSLFLSFFLSGLARRFESKRARRGSGTRSDGRGGDLSRGAERAGGIMPRERAVNESRRGSNVKGPPSIALSKN